MDVLPPIMPTPCAFCLSSAWPLPGPPPCLSKGLHSLSAICLQLALKGPLRERSHPTFIFKVERDFFMNRFAGGRGSSSSSSTAQPGSLVHLEEQRQGPLGRR